jgi:hypothetical protein
MMLSGRVCLRREIQFELAVTFVSPFQVEWEVEAVTLLELALALILVQGVG